MLEWLAQKLPELTGTEWDSVGLLLLDDESIAQTNRDYFGKDRPTDVISFRYDPIPGEPPAFSGDLLVNVQRALQEGPNQKGSSHELALYIAHGIDHLSGSEDDTPEKRAAMLSTETAWLEEAQDLGLLPPLFPPPLDSETKDVNS